MGTGNNWTEAEAKLALHLGGGSIIGPIIVGTAKPAHIVTQLVSVPRVLNMTEIAVVRAQGDG